MIVSCMQVDPLSDVLSLLKPQTYVAGGLDLGGDWAIQYNEHSGVKYFALVSGACWLEVEGEAVPIRLEAGDCVLLPNGKRFVMAKDLGFQRTHFERFSEADWRGGIAYLNGGGDTMILGGHFAYSGAHADILLGAMPPIVRLRDVKDKLGLRWVLERMRAELVEAQPGGNLVVQHLAHLMLVQALRLYLSEGAGQTVGWLFAMQDPKISAAISAIHSDPGIRWTLPMLASRAGMSKSKFSLRFKSISGSSPIEYLTRWRMLLAGDRLVAGKESVSVIAMALGYDSEASFSTAFKRVMGCAPRRYGALSATTSPALSPHRLA
ncbi:AraC family transcriptional regulator [Rhizobium sp.]